MACIPPAGSGNPSPFCSHIRGGDKDPTKMAAKGWGMKAAGEGGGRWKEMMTEEWRIDPRTKTPRRQCSKFVLKKTRKDLNR